MTTSLERVVRPNETVQTVFGTGYYTYIAPHIDNTGIADTVTLTVSAKTSTQTTEITGIGYQLNWKRRQEIVEINRNEATVTIKDPDSGEEIAKEKALKDIAIRPIGSNLPTQHIRYSYPNSDNTALNPPDPLSPSSSSQNTSAPSTVQPLSGTGIINSIPIRTE